MGNVFRVRPVHVKRANGQVLTPDMEITVTTQSYTSDPFYNGAKEIQILKQKLQDIILTVWKNAKKSVHQTSAHFQVLRQNLQPMGIMMKRNHSISSFLFM